MDRQQLLIGAGTTLLIAGGAFAYNVNQMGSLGDYRDDMLGVGWTSLSVFGAADALIYSGSTSSGSLIARSKWP